MEAKKFDQIVKARANTRGASWLRAATSPRSAKTGAINEKDMTDPENTPITDRDLGGPCPPEIMQTGERIRREALAEIWHVTEDAHVRKIAERALHAADAANVEACRQIVAHGQAFRAAEREKAKERLEGGGYGE